MLRSGRLWGGWLFEKRGLNANNGETHSRVFSWFVKCRRLGFKWLWLIKIIKTRMLVFVEPSFLWRWEKGRFFCVQFCDFNFEIKSFC